MKKIGIIILSSLLMIQVLGSVSYAQESVEIKNPFGKQIEHNVEKQEFNKREYLLKKKAEMDKKLNSIELSALSVKERLNLIHDSILLELFIYEQYKTRLTIPSNSNQLYEVWEYLQNEQELMFRKSQLLNEIFSNKENREVVEEEREKIYLIIDSLKALREAGRELHRMVQNNFQLEKTKQLKSLEHMATISVKNRDIETATRTLTEMIQIDEQDSDYKEILIHLLESDKSYFMLENELFVLDDFILLQNERQYISVNDLKKILDLDLSKEDDMYRLLYKNREISFNKETLKINNIEVGSIPFLMIHHGKEYVDALFIFKLLGYEIRSSDNYSLLIANYKIYPYDEIDFLETKKIVDAILHEIK